MAEKEKWLYYECVYPCEVGFMGPDQRKERQVPGQMPRNCLHTITLIPSDPYNPKKLPDILAVKRPLAPSYVSEVEKIVNRKNLRTGLREDHPKKSKIKFALLEGSDVTDSVIRRARRMELTESHYAPVEA